MRSFDRMDRVNAQLLRLLSKLVQSEYQTPDLVTLTDVHTTRDLEQAKVSVSAQSNLREHVQALNKRARGLRNALRPQLDFKVIPNLTFIEDAANENIVAVESILDKLP